VRRSDWENAVTEGSKDGAPSTPQGEGADRVPDADPAGNDVEVVDGTEVSGEDEEAGGGQGSGGLLGDVEDPGLDEDPLEDIVTERPLEAAVPLRSPLALAGTSVAGFLMGTAEVVPGFSGGTVALVVGIYERLIANVRQGARTLSLLVRGRVDPALRSFLAIEWLFVTALLTGMLIAVFTVASTLRRLIEEEPTLLKAVLFGLVLGAAVVAARELRAATVWHVLMGVVVAFGTFFGLGASGGVFLEPTVVTIFFGAAIAVCAWILPGVSGSFLLLLLGLWQPVVDAVADVRIGILLVVAVGCIAGLASFSTLLNWLMARFHDVVLAALIGLMVGSVRVLWPYPSDAPFENVELGAPEGTDAFLALALALTAFSLVWIVGLIATGVARRRRQRAAVIADVDGALVGGEDEVPPARPLVDEPPPDDPPRPPSR
jgi:putative membrane protein